MNVVGVPVKVGERSVIMTCIEHDQIEQRPDGEGSPDTEIVVHLDLSTVQSVSHSNGLEVGSLD